VWGKDANALERIERKEVIVTGDDVRRVSAHSQFEKFIVLGISASLYLHIHIDPLSFARQSSEKTSNIFLIDVSAKLLPA
jgi:hypothetical protein